MPDIPETTPGASAGITPGAIVRTPEGARAHVDDVGGNAVLVSLITPEGRITDEEQTWTLASLTLDTPAPAADPDGRATVGLQIDTSEPIAALQDLNERAQAFIDRLTAAEDRAESIEESIASTNVALDAMPAKLNGLTMQAGLLAGQVSAASDSPGDPVINARQRLAAEWGVGEVHGALEISAIPSRRDLAAHAALTALGSCGPGASDMNDDPEWYAAAAYRIADAMESAAAAPRTEEAAR